MQRMFLDRRIFNWKRKFSGSEGDSDRITTIFLILKEQERNEPEMIHFAFYLWF